jgi:hypothetical protein
MRIHLVCQSFCRSRHVAFTQTDCVYKPESKALISVVTCTRRGLRRRNAVSDGHLLAPVPQVTVHTNIMITYSLSPKHRSITLPSQWYRLALQLLLPSSTTNHLYNLHTPQRSLSTRASVQQRATNPATPHYLPPLSNGAKRACYTPY